MVETAEEMQWKPLYPNNMTCNGLDGYYCLMFYKHKDGTISCRKYTIEFQFKEVIPGSGFIDTKEIDRYVLFEKIYPRVEGPLEYPEPTEDWFGHVDDTANTLNTYDVNSYGSFVYAYDSLELAKQRAYTQYRHIYGYVLSFLDENQQ